MVKLYEVSICEDTQLPALYRRFSAKHPGAMSGREIIAPVEEFGAIEEAIAKYRQEEELKVLTEAHNL